MQYMYELEIISESPSWTFQLDFKEDAKKDEITATMWCTERSKNEMDQKLASLHITYS